MRHRWLKASMGALSAKAWPAFCSFDVVGDIAILRSSERSNETLQDLAGKILGSNQHLKSVFVQEGPVIGSFRLHRLVHVAGENKTETIHKENGCRFRVDLRRCYFSSRLSGERSRIAQLVGQNETIVNMFAGVGCFSIVIARKEETATVFSVDVNPCAVRLMTENVRVNRVYPRVVPILGDAKEIVERQFRGPADRVLLPLPEKALEYLPTAIFSLKSGGG